MTDETPPHRNGTVSIRDVYEIVSRLETKVDARLAAVDDKVDSALSRLDRLEGGIGLIKWLGPAGVGSVLLGLIALAAK